MGKDNKLNINIDTDTGETRGEELYRITVTKLGQDALSAVVEKVNDGFFGGKINRTQAANWIMMQFNANLTDLNIKEIRAEHFDELTMFESILKKAKESGKVPPEFRALLQKQLENDDSIKKKSKKAFTENIINDDIKV